MAVVAPKYLGICARANCGKPSGYVIVLHFWPKSMLSLLRGKDNSTKMFPDVEACDEHKFSLVEIAQYFFQRSLGSVYSLFDSLGRGEPDIRGMLIDLVTVHDAEKMWLDPDASSPADGQATIIQPANSAMH